MNKFLKSSLDRAHVLVALAGLSLLISYWISVRPPAPRTGFAEDMCFTDFARQLSAEQMQQYGRPYFHTDRVMTPMGASIPFMSWSPERDWLGGLVWRWDPNFPFSWAFTGLSWLTTFLVLAIILTRIGKILGFSRSTAFAIATAVTIFHVPRHFKIWHHWEHLQQHWMYAGFFLDAWLWVRLTREKTWDWRLELWRGLCVVGMTMGVGTFWGPLLLEWVLFRVCEVVLVMRMRGQNFMALKIPKLRESWEWSLLCLILGNFLLLIALRWYLPLAEEVKRVGPVFQPMAWFANIGFFVRPLWLEPLAYVFHRHPFQSSIDGPETVVSVGWFYWIPALISFGALARARAWRMIAPFAMLLVIAVIYASVNEETHYFQRFIQMVIPFMQFFRVSSRWGLFLPQILTIITVLSWPELRTWWMEKLASRAKKAWIGAACVFAFLSCVEFSWLLYAVNVMPPLPVDAERLLKDIHDSPGTAVLDLPFCVAGGNAICTGDECPQYPNSTISECFRLWHDKKVYGLYQPRMADSHCNIYHQQPYDTWFSAWKGNRCFSEPEWQQFCRYVDLHGELSAILLYADVWKVSGTPSCLASFEKHLGKPIGGTVVPTAPTRGGMGDALTRVFRYRTHCLR